LPEIDPSYPADFTRLLLARRLNLLDLVPANQLDPFDTLTETIRELLIGPLVWLGVLVKDEGREARWKDEDTTSTLRLTRQGLVWLTGQVEPADPLPPSAKFSLATDFQPDPLDSTMTLTLSDGLPDPADLVVALEVGSSLLS
jgi:hypothetical protein